VAEKKKIYTANSRIETVVEGKKVIIKSGTELEMSAKEAEIFGSCVSLNESVEDPKVKGSAGSGS